MKQIPIDTCIDIQLFENDLKDIDRKFIRKIVYIYKISAFRNHIGFLFITNHSTYVYGHEICKWLSLQHDSKRPQEIDIFDGQKIIQIDSGDKFVVVLTNDGLVYLASNDNSKWRTKNTFRLISTGNDRFEMIACGKYHLLLLGRDGAVYALGDNLFGQLTGNVLSSYDVLVNTYLKNVKLIACGAKHCLALTNANTICSWGWNKFGQLGLGNKSSRRTPSPVLFSNDSPIKNIMAGAWYSLFLLENGQIFGCGYYQRSLNDQKQDAKVPTKIAIENVQSVACKNDDLFSLAFDQSSNYYVWGMMRDEEFVSPKKVDHQPESFAAASAILCKSPMTYGLTLTIDIFESTDSISFIGLLDNPDNYDVEFIIGNERILASKCHLKMSSKYYSRMFSGVWQENDKVIIKDYNYDVYYSYLVMLHNGNVRINQSNIAQLIDLANCYGDERLMKHCRSFIRRNLNEQTLFTYLPLISNYQLDGMNDKLVEITIEDVLPKITDNLLENKENVTKFLELIISESFIKKE
uniref:RCC1 and BTB domain-containing protein 2-like n=1 Tax=Dermatophagoides pteronyssinus TaxID=6956 RepID=A0A6P6YA57_DERPT|nr:RCC1 and BTB domain-containing protein 2-like [Dermatophagoides pteronyssinus]